MPGTLPVHHSLGKQPQPRAGQQCHPLLPGHKSQLVRLGRGRCLRQKGKVMGKGMGVGRWRVCTLQQVAGCQVATGDGSISASPAELPGTSYPCLGGKGGFDKARGYSQTPSPGRVPKAAPGCGKETGPVVMFVPAQGALQPVGGRLSITAITSSWLQVHGALSWDSF